MIVLAPEVEAALRDGAPVVALETTLVAHGFPPGEGVAVGAESERRVREAGAVPATIGVLDGAVRVGLGAEALETLGVPVLGFGTDELPLFYAARGGPPVSARVETPAEAAAIARAHWELGGGGLLLARPPDESLDDVEPLIEEALTEARRLRVEGGAVTPFVLAKLHERSGGRTLRANRELVAANAQLAAEVAAA